MSSKITAKNLSYDTSLPPFLARLKGQHDRNSASGPDPMLAARRRPGQVRSASEEAEDAPVVVDEEGNVVEGGIPGENDDDTENKDEAAAKGEGKDDSEEGENSNKISSKARAAGIGASKKRKAGRIVGGEGEEKKGDGAPELRKAIEEATATQKKNESKDETATADDGASAKKPAKTKKKAKKIKLSFDDEGA